MYGEHGLGDGNGTDVLAENKANYIQFSLYFKSLDTETIKQIPTYNVSTFQRYANFDQITSIRR